MKNWSRGRLWNEVRKGGRKRRRKKGKGGRKRRRKKGRGEM